MTLNPTGRDDRRFTENSAAELLQPPRLWLPLRLARNQLRSSQKAFLRKRRLVILCPVRVTGSGASYA